MFNSGSLAARRRKPHCLAPLQQYNPAMLAITPRIFTTPDQGGNLGIPSFEIPSCLRLIKGLQGKIVEEHTPHEIREMVAACPDDPHFSPAYFQVEDAIAAARRFIELASGNIPSFRGYVDSVRAAPYQLADGAMVYNPRIVAKADDDFRRSAEEVEGFSNEEFEAFKLAGNQLLWRCGAQPMPASLTREQYITIMGKNIDPINDQALREGILYVNVTTHFSPALLLFPSRQANLMCQLDRLGAMAAVGQETSWMVNLRGEITPP